jgi:hypothetical protein
MKKGKALLVGALVLALAASGLMQSVIQNSRGKLRTGAAGTGSSSLARMDSFALALLLGGLRGPLVMFLWTNSETQKSSKQLEGVDTQIEWIRLLQPEFDTVHLFQIWNKAYNISAQMAALPNKYATILDAADYARSVDHERPDNVNILSTLGQIFNDKLGNSQEKEYYRRRVRQDSLYSPGRAQAGDRGRRLAMPVLLDAEHNLLPQYLRPTLAAPLTQTSPVEQRYDGAELQFLAPYQPFPYGVSTSAIGFNYYKRSQVLQDLTRQRHIQMSEMVVDTRPALSLQMWGAEEWERGRRAEITATGGRASGERLALEPVTAALKPGDGAFAAGKSEAADAAFAESLFSYERAIRIYSDSSAEFSRHISNPQYAENSQRYQWQLSQMAAFRAYLGADLAWLRAQRLSGDEQKQLLAEAGASYRTARRLFRLMRLRYYVQDNHRAMIYPAGIKQATVDQMSDEQIEVALKRLRQLTDELGGDMYGEDVAEYKVYLERCEARLGNLK